MKRGKFWPFVALLVVLLIGGGMLWWRAVYSNPQRVFEAMLDNSLRLRGVSRELNEDDGTQKVQQITQLSLGAEPVVTSQTTLTQNDGQGTKIVTENIGTPTSDYVRYTAIETDQKGNDGQALDFGSLLNVWGRQEVTPGNITDGQLYNETVLGLIPFGNLKAQNRNELLKLIQDNRVYDVDYDKTGRSLQNGRPRYEYDVTVDPAAYVKLLKRYGELAGLNNLSEFDPNAYAQQERVGFKVAVDVWSRQMVGIDYGQAGRSETLSGHNVAKTVDVPTETISVEQLQTRLQQLQ